MSYFDIDMSDRFTFGGPRSLKALIGICLHTTENSASSTAVDVADWQARTQTGSYNVLVDSKGTRVRANTDNWITWSTGNKGNSVLLHLSFVAYSAWSRQEWLAQDKMLRAGATVVAHWCKTYGFPVKKAVPVGQLPGITTHDATRAWGSTDHTDPGPNFPWDVFLSYVNQNMGAATASAPATTPKESSVTVLSGVSAEALNIARVQSSEANAKVSDLVKRVANVEEKIEIAVSQLAGGGRTKDNKVTYSGWPQLGVDSTGAARTLVDAVAHIAETQKAIMEKLAKLEGK